MNNNQIFIIKIPTDGYDIIGQCVSPHFTLCDHLQSVLGRSNIKAVRVSPTWEQDLLIENTTYAFCDLTPGTHIEEMLRLLNTPLFFFLVFHS